MMKKLLYFIAASTLSFQMYAQTILVSESFGYLLITEYAPSCVQEISQGVFYLDTTCTELLNITNFNCSYCTNIGDNELTYLKGVENLHLESLTVANSSGTLKFPSNVKSIYFQDNVVNKVAIPAGLKHLTVKSTVFDYGILPNGLVSLTGIELQDPKPLQNIPDSLETFSYWFYDSLNNVNSAFPSFSNALKLKSVQLSNYSTNPQYFDYKKLLSELNPNVEKITIIDFNTLDSIPALPSGLQHLKLFDQSLVQLDAFPTDLKELSLQGAFECLPEYPASLLKLEVFSTATFCHPNYLPGVMPCENLCVMPDASPNNCTFNPLIRVKAYADLNYSCQYEDSMDVYLKEIPFQLYDANMNLLASGSTDSYGNFGMEVPNGTYTVKLDTNQTALLTSCGAPIQQSIVIDALNPYGEIVFLLVCDSTKLNQLDSYDAQAINISASPRRLPGATIDVCFGMDDYLFDENTLCAYAFPSTFNPTVQVKVLGPVTYTGTSSYYTATVSGDTTTITYIDTMIVAQLMSKLCLPFLIDTTAQSGDQICVTLNIIPNANDLNPANNSMTSCFEIRNSYDPNMKETWPTKVLPGFDDEIRYTIHFQNTGTAPAINVQLVDTLDALLDLTTFQVIEASHSVQPYLSGNRLLFKFNNINLADSLSDPEASQGYVSYSIKPKTAMQLNDEIHNTAHIYFDFNPAIVTNTSVNLCTNNLTGTDELKTEKDVFIVYPNPINGENTIRVRNLPASESKVQLLQINGTVIGEYLLTNAQNAIDVSKLQAGIYLLNLEVNGALVSKKVIKL